MKNSKPVHALVKFQENKIKIIERVEVLLNEGYLDISDMHDKDEMDIIRNAVKVYKRHLLRK